MWRDKIQIYLKCGKPVSKTCQDEHHQCGARSCVINTQIFSHKPIHLWVKKCHSLTLKYKQDIHLTTKKYVCTVKDFKTTSKSINQIKPVLMP